MFYHLPWRQKLPLFDLIRILCLGVIGYFAFAMVIGATVGLAKVWHLVPPGQMREVVTTFTSAVQLPVLLLILLLLYRVGPTGNLGAKLGIKPLRGSDFWQAAAGLIQIYILGYAAQVIWKFLLEKLHIPFVEEQGLTEILKTMSPPAFTMMIFTVAVAAPVCEEIFFRRLLYDLVQRFCGRHAVVVTSLIFSAIHCFIFGVPMLFIVGYFCQRQYLRSRNLATPIMIHMIFNSVTLAAVGLKLQ